MSAPITTAKRIRICADIARILRHGASYTQVPGYTQAYIRDLYDHLTALERETTETA